MKAEKTRELIELSIAINFGNRPLNLKELDTLCGESHEELTELERLATIGRYTEMAFEKTDRAMFVSYWQEEEGGEFYVDMNRSFDFDGLDELITWGEKQEGDND